MGVLDVLQLLEQSVCEAPSPDCPVAATRADHLFLDVEVKDGNAALVGAGLGEDAPQLLPLLLPRPYRAVAARADDEGLVADVPQSLDALGPQRAVAARARHRGEGILVEPPGAQDVVVARADHELGGGVVGERAHPTVVRPRGRGDAPQALAPEPPSSDGTVKSSAHDNASGDVELQGQNSFALVPLLQLGDLAQFAAGCVGPSVDPAVDSGAQDRHIVPRGPAVRELQGEDSTLVRFVRGGHRGAFVHLELPDLDHRVVPGAEYHPRTRLIQ
mmetsp:Transcript_38869/g.112375  ORF Transcript_38869/g.112375 Transcript_38869/m.112375 type:complete len:274 (-) Transcript_38869:530-1351(-)